MIRVPPRCARGFSATVLGVLRSAVNPIVKMHARQGPWQPPRHIPILPVNEERADALAAEAAVFRVIQRKVRMEVFPETGDPS